MNDRPITRTDRHGHRYWGRAFPLNLISSYQSYWKACYASLKLNNLVRGPFFFTRYESFPADEELREEPIHIYSFPWVINTVKNLDGLLYFVSGNDRIMNPDAWLLDRNDERKVLPLVGSREMWILLVFPPGLHQVERILIYGVVFFITTLSSHRWTFFSNVLST